MRSALQRLPWNCNRSQRSWLSDLGPPRGFAGTQQGLSAASGCRARYQSSVHSQTLPIMSVSPKPLDGNVPPATFFQNRRRRGSATEIPPARHWRSAPIGLELIAPGKLGVFGPAPGRKLPFCFSRQSFPRPFGKGGGVAVRDVDNGVVEHLRAAAFRPIGMAPIGAEPKLPPLAPVGQIHGMTRRRKHQRSRMAFPAARRDNRRD